jgi:hypothetical protein
MMKRENKYFVLKRSDIAKYISERELGVLSQIADKVHDSRVVEGKEPFECVVVEHDWPEYEKVWAMLTYRVDKAGDKQETKQYSDSYVHVVPDKCDRIVWKNAYYHLPLSKNDKLRRDAQNYKRAVFESLIIAIHHAKVSSNPFDFLCTQIEAMDKTEFAVSTSSKIAELEDENKMLREKIMEVKNTLKEISGERNPSPYSIRFFDLQGKAKQALNRLLGGDND